MDSELRKKIDGSARVIGALMEYSWAEDPETREYALSKIVEYYMEEKKFGVLKGMCLSIQLPEKTRERAGMAMVSSIKQQNKGSAAPAEGILEDIALSTKTPGKVRVAAGKLRADLLSARAKEGKEPGAAAAKKKLAVMAGHGKHHQDVRVHARNSLDALELANEGKKPALPARRGTLQQKKANVRI